MFPGGNGPTLRTIYGWFEDIRHANFTLDKGHTTGRPRSRRTPDLIQTIKTWLKRTPEYLFVNWRTMLVSPSLQYSDRRPSLKVLLFSLVPTLLTEKNRIECCERLIEFLSGQISDVYCVQDEL